MSADALDIDCPKCGAPAGFPCNAAVEGEPRYRPHIQRIADAHGNMTVDDPDAVDAILESMWGDE